MILGIIPRTARLEIPGRHVWCCAPALTDDGRCHLLFSTWPASAGFEAWVTHSEVWHAEGPSPAGPFTVTGPVLAGAGGDRWDGRVVHNPTIARWGDRWVLFYMGTTGPTVPAGHVAIDEVWWSYRNRQRIGVAVADHPRGPWRRCEQPLVDVEPEGWARLIASNPAAAQGPDGRWRMIYKTVEAGPMPFGGRVLHAVATADSPLGPFVREPEPVFTADGVQFPVEDPCLWWEEQPEAAWGRGQPPAGRAGPSWGRRVAAADRRGAAIAGAAAGAWGREAPGEAETSGTAGAGAGEAGASAVGGRSRRQGSWHAVTCDRLGTFSKAGRSWARFTSADGVAWRPAGQPCAARLDLRWDDGAVETVERLERPQVLMAGGRVRWMAGAAKQRERSFALIAPVAG